MSLKIALAGIGVGLVFLAGFLAGSSKQSSSADRKSDSETGPNKQKLSALDTPPSTARVTAASLKDLQPWPDDTTAREKTFATLRTIDPLERQAIWMKLIMTANAVDLKEIETATGDWYRSGGGLGPEFGQIQVRAGQVLGSEALETLTTNANGKLLSGPLRRMKGWASVSPDDARAWLEALPESSVKSQLKSALLEGLVPDSPEMAAELFTSMPVENREGGIDILYDSLHRFGGMKSVVDWFTETAGGEAIEGVDMNQAFHKLTWKLGALGAKDPGAVEEALLRPAVAPFLTGDTFADATRSAAVDDPGRVINLITELSERAEEGQLPDMREMIAKTVHQSTYTTFNKLGNWLSENPDHPLYNVTTRYFVEWAASEDPYSASQWQKTITDPALAEEASLFVVE